MVVDSKFVVEEAEVVGTQDARTAVEVALAKAGFDNDFDIETRPDPSMTDCNCILFDIDSFAAVAAGFDKNQPPANMSKLIEF